ncbi:MAG TPA: hypothetical protein VKO86_04825 [Gemmatimonadales bacterium]|nr:hypothetical protein [Gemmatimonadales bacterium]
MPINFIPNDPKASGGPPMRRKTPRAERASTVAGFTYVPHAPAAPLPLGDPGFLFWQSREAALAAVAAFEALDGKKVSRWARSTNRRRLALKPNAGTDLNAYYDGQSLNFFEYTTGAKTTWSGASTDVVAHESGHALLDQSRPDLWDSSYPETNAFHEAFGDCMAILTAFADPATRTNVRTSLGRRNFVEATAEDLSDGVRRALGPSHPASQPRHARNTFQWALPSTLPASGPPNVLSSEVHSFARIFSGCFYDTILNILRARIGAAKTPTSTQLDDAVRTAGTLLLRAAAEAPETVRFFQAVGRAMVLVDQNTNQGANGTAIHDAFQQHNVALGSAAMLAPVAALGGTVGRRGALSRSAVQDLRARLGATPAERMLVQPREIGGVTVVCATHLKQVPLGRLDRRLKGVVAIATRPVLVRKVDRTAAVLDGVPEATTSDDEVKAFVESLLISDRIAFEPGETRYGIKAAAKRDTRLRLPTHAVHTVRAMKVLRRVRFAC